MIVIHVYFCHTVKQAERIVSLIKDSPAADRHLIFHTCKYDFEGVLCLPDVIDRVVPNVYTVRTGTAKSRDLKCCVYEGISREGTELPGAYIEVDLTNANPEESFTVCWVSVALDLRAYIQKDNGKDKYYFGPVPAFVKLSPQAAAVVDHYGAEGRPFTNEEVCKDGVVGNEQAAGRATKELARGKFLDVKPRRTHRAGPDVNEYTVNDEGDYMASMNRRAERRKKAGRDGKKHNRSVSGRSCHYI